MYIKTKFHPKKVTVLFKIWILIKFRSDKENKLNMNVIQRHTKEIKEPYLKENFEVPMEQQAKRILDRKEQSQLLKYLRRASKATKILLSLSCLEGKAKMWDKYCKIQRELNR